VYEEAVKAPYDSIKEENPEARAAGWALIAEGQAAGPNRRTFVYGLKGMRFPLLRPCLPLPHGEWCR
jgi:hypothetical protein